MSLSSRLDKLEGMARRVDSMPAEIMEGWERIAADPDGPALVAEFCAMAARVAGELPPEAHVAALRQRLIFDDRARELMARFSEIAGGLCLPHASLS